MPHHPSVSGCYRVIRHFPAQLKIRRRTRRTAVVHDIPKRAHCKWSVIKIRNGSRFSFRWRRHIGEVMDRPISAQKSRLPRAVLPDQQGYRTNRNALLFRKATDIGDGEFLQPRPTKRGFRRGLGQFRRRFFSRFSSWLWPDHCRSQFFSFRFGTISSPASAPAGPVAQGKHRHFATKPPFASIFSIFSPRPQKSLNLKNHPHRLLKNQRLRQIRCGRRRLPRHRQHPRPARTRKSRRTNVNLGPTPCRKTTDAPFPRMRKARVFVAGADSQLANPLRGAGDLHASSLTMGERRF